MNFLASLMSQKITTFTLTIKLFRVRLEIKPIGALVLMMNVHLLVSASCHNLWKFSL
jgi:hypothetical protein